MRLMRFAVEFGMKLAREEKRMLGQFDHLDQFAVHRIAAENKIGLGKTIAVIVVEFVAMAMAFVHDERAVELRGLGADDQLAGLRAEAHGTTLFGDFF